MGFREDDGLLPEALLEGIGVLGIARLAPGDLRREGLGAPSAEEESKLGEGAGQIGSAHDEQSQGRQDGFHGRTASLKLAAACEQQEETEQDADPSGNGHEDVFHLHGVGQVEAAPGATVFIGHIYLMDIQG